jgi:secondary thiamine-phosphate synthase enzyme
VKELQLKTSQKNQVIDLTDRVRAALPAGRGAVLVLAAHTTCCITTADLDPGTDLDFLGALRHLLPEMRYRHPHDPEHTPDHILASLIGPSVVIPFDNGNLILGTWQRIVLVELDGPRERNLYLSFLTEAG